MSEIKMLSGEVEDGRDVVIADLHEEVQRLRGELSIAKADVARATRDTGRAIGELRRQLLPLYRALQAVFGEMDAVGFEVEEGAKPGSRVEARVRALWDSWQEKLGRGSAPSRMIDALLTHGEMNVAQIKVAAKMATQTVYDAASKLNRLGLITKNGGGTR